MLGELLFALWVVFVAGSCLWLIGTTGSEGLALAYIALLTLITLVVADRWNGRRR